MRLYLLPAASLCAILTLHASAQCPPAFDTPLGNAWPNGGLAATWDPDGPGPIPERVVVAGNFPADGDEAYNPSRGTIAMWDGSRWQVIAASLTTPSISINPYITSMTAWDPDGSGPRPPLLIAAGVFSSINGVAAANIASWDGTVWRPLGDGADGSVQALTVWDPDGPGPATPRLIAGGAFSHAGGELTGAIASWNGAAWSGIGWGLSGTTSFGTIPAVYALTTWDHDSSAAPPSRLVAGGNFVFAGSNITGGITAHHLAAWDGSTWQEVGGGVVLSYNNEGDVTNLFTWDPDASGPLPRELVCGGYFDRAGAGAAQIPVSYGAAWNGTTWRDLQAVTSIDPDGDGPLPEQLFRVTRASPAQI